MAGGRDWRRRWSPTWPSAVTACTGWRCPGRRSTTVPNLTGRNRAGRCRKGGGQPERPLRGPRERIPARRDRRRLPPARGAAAGAPAARAAQAGADPQERARRQSTIVVFGGTQIVEPRGAEQRLGALRATRRRSPRSRAARGRARRVAKVALLRRGPRVRRASCRRPASIARQADYVDHRRRAGHHGGRQPRRLRRRRQVHRPQHHAARRAAAQPVHHARAVLPVPLLRDPQDALPAAGRALVAFPGGFGTLDELFEVLTLVQTGKSRMQPILLFGREFWTRLIDFDFLVDEGDDLARGRQALPVRRERGGSLALAGLRVRGDDLPGELALDI